MSPRMNNSENNYINSNSDSDSNEEQYIENIINNNNNDDEENFGNYYSNENTYDSEEPSLTKYNLVFCELSTPDTYDTVLLI